jgi:H+/Cl- antiporter ClcA
LRSLCPGTVNWALPATVGNGNIIFPWIIKYGHDGQISEKLLLCTAFARMFLLGVSMNCGFVGGIIFPFLTIGIIAGTLTYTHYTFLPLGLCISSFMISISCGIVPMPFTFTCLSAFAFYNGLYQIVPIFISAITSYLIVCGSGLFKKLSSRAQEQKNAADALDREENERKQKEIAKLENDDYNLNQYLGNKKQHASGASLAGPTTI